MPRGRHIRLAVGKAVPKPWAFDLASAFGFGTAGGWTRTKAPLAHVAAAVPRPSPLVRRRSSLAARPSPLVSRRSSPLRRRTRRATGGAGLTEAHVRIPQPSGASTALL